MQRRGGEGTVQPCYSLRDSLTTDIIISSGVRKLLQHSNINDCRMYCWRLDPGLRINTDMRAGGNSELSLRYLGG